MAGGPGGWETGGQTLIRGKRPLPRPRGSSCAEEGGPVASPTSLWPVPKQGGSLNLEATCTSVTRILSEELTLSLSIIPCSLTLLPEPREMTLG